MWPLPAQSPSALDTTKEGKWKKREMEEEERGMMDKSEIEG